MSTDDLARRANADEAYSWSAPRVLKRAVDLRCTAVTPRGPYTVRCHALATDVIDRADGTSTPVCPEHGGRS